MLIDANIFFYAAGRESPQREPCQRFLRTATALPPAARPSTNSEVLQEILHRHHSQGRTALACQAFDAILDLGLTIHPVGAREMTRARQLLESHPHLATRDAVHLGVMLERGLEELVSYDRGFDAVPWVRRREP